MSEPRRDVLIGIATSFVGGVQKLRRDYVHALELAGAVPVLLPVSESPSVARALTRRLDGLLMTGGPAITTRLVGRLPDDLGETDPMRVRSDENVVSAFLDAGKPILGICYGMQLLNALGGGSIYADVERQVSGALVHAHRRGESDHTIAIEPGTTLSDLLGEAELTVNSRHVQALAEVASDYRVSARATDGIPEAVESADGRVVGVQFHPELMGERMSSLFRHLVLHARASNVD